VANHLNDISKDHPALVADLAARWLVGADQDLAWVVRHACRGLVKAGHQPTLQALGYGPARVELVRLDILTPEVQLGQPLRLEVVLRSLSRRPQPLILDYAIHHQKARGGTSPKVFKGKTFTLEAQGDFVWRRRHPIKPITTRTYYPGEHRVEILANGDSLGQASFWLHVPQEAP
jgi:hypothetical protein